MDQPLRGAIFVGGKDNSCIGMPRQQLVQITVDFGMMAQRKCYPRLLCPRSAVGSDDM
jgi:hypothetical protein